MVHLSNENIVRVNWTEQPIASDKPNGMYFCRPGEWLAYCANDPCFPSRPVYKHSYTPANADQLRIYSLTLDNLAEFDRQFRSVVTDYPGDRYDWQKLADAEYDGIHISPGVVALIADYDLARNDSWYKAVKGDMAPSEALKAALSMSTFGVETLVLWNNRAQIVRS